MKAIFSLRRHSYLKTVGVFLIAVALIAGVVGCGEGEGEPDTYNLIMAVTPAGGGTAVDVTGASPYEEDADVSIQANPAAGYQFVMWTASAGTFANANAATTTFTMPAQNVTVTAHFVGPLDHFKCYGVEEAAPTGKVVYLEDQFVARNATVGMAWYFCNPTEKLHDDVLTPMSNPDHHLMIYQLDYGTELQTRFVEVDNQFGLQELMVRGPIALAVPTTKVEPGNHEPPLLLDHYLLYEVLGGPPVEAVVTLNDQFSGEPDAVVYEPVYLANPVLKEHDGVITEIVDEGTHLMFYRIAVEDGPFSTQVQIDNQFSEGTFDVFDPALLAVPSTKTELSAPPPLDHFKGYTLLGPVGAIENEVYLEDQFSAFWASADVAYEFFTPAVKWHEGVPTELWYPDNDIMLFDISYTGEFPDWEVTVFNQFGPQVLGVGAPVKLAVPTAEFFDEPLPPPVDLDHFLLYEAFGPPIELPVTLDDQFVTGEEVLVLEPVFFANPVQKTHGDVTPILNPWGHLVFYRITGDFLGVTAFFSNQFGAFSLIPWQSYYLAVPTEKWSYAVIPPD